MINITRTEIAGWLQVVIGLIALFFTVKSGGPALEAIAQVGSGGGLPADFMGAQGMIRVFLFLLALTTTLMLLLVGLGMLLGAVFRHMGAAMPNHAAFSLISGVILLCLTICFGIFGVPIWPGLGFLTLLAVVLTGIASTDESGEPYWVVLLAGGGGSIFVGLLVAMTMTAPNPTSTDQRNIAAAQTASDSASVAAANAASTAKAGPEK